MNRRQKIIVSVVGIFIVLLALVGITYGYFLTRIQGNTNTTSITVTTADLALVYGDGTNKVITGDKIIPGTVIGEKDFTVTNTGDDSSYVVIIDGDNDLTNGITPISVTYATAGTTIEGEPYTEGQTTEFKSNDFVYTLSCEIESANAERDGQSCNGQSLEMTFSFKGSVIAGNDIKKGDIHHYVLKVTYKDNGNQSLDMNKTFNAVVNIEDIGRINPYKTADEEANKQSLAYNIINNALINKNGTELMATPITKVGYEVTTNNTAGAKEENVYLDETKELLYYGTDDNDYAFSNCIYSYGVDGYENCTGVTIVDENTTCEDYEGQDIAYKDSSAASGASRKSVIECVDGKAKIGTAKYEKVLSTTQDDYGTSYYYRGMVNDNYVNYAGMCWRVVRVQGDGSVKIILEDQENLCANSSVNWSIGNGGFGMQILESESKEIANYLHPTNPAMAASFKNYQTTLAKKLNSNLTDSSSLTEINNELSKTLKSGDWCLSYNAYDGVDGNLIDRMDYIYDNNIIFYESTYRLAGTEIFPTLVCRGDLMPDFDDTSKTPMYVGTLNVDEIVYAGDKVIPNIYIDFDYSLSGESKNYLNNGNFPTLSLNIYYPHNYSDFQYYSDGNGDVSGYRPSVILKNGIEITGGTGIKTDPYVIKQY